MMIPYRISFVAINEITPPTREAIAIPTNIPPLDLFAISNRDLMSSRKA